MGMFAYVDFKMACPLCGTVLTEWQTKDPDDLDLQRVPVASVSNYYTDCSTVVWEDEFIGDRLGVKWTMSMDNRRWTIVGCKAWLEFDDGVLRWERKKP